MTINEAINHDNASLVDVRTHEEVAMESVPGATHIPLDEIPVRWEEFKSMPRPLVLFAVQVEDQDRPWNSWRLKE